MGVGGSQIRGPVWVGRRVIYAGPQRTFPGDFTCGRALAIAERPAGEPPLWAAPVDPSSLREGIRKIPGSRSARQPQSSEHAHFFFRVQHRARVALEPAEPLIHLSKTDLNLLIDGPNAPGRTGTVRRKRRVFKRFERAGGPMGWGIRIKGGASFFLLT